MNRRNFLGGLFGAILAPKVLPKLETLSKEKEVILTALDYEVLGYTGTEILDSGIVYAPYIPICKTRDIEQSLKEHISKEISSEIDQKLIKEFTIYIDKNLKRMG